MNKLQKKTINFDEVLYKISMGVTKEKMWFDWKKLN